MERQITHKKTYFTAVTHDLLRLGFKYINSNDFGSASRIFRMAHENEPTDNVRYALGLAYARAGKLDEAQKVFSTIGDKDGRAQIMARRLERYESGDRFCPLSETGMAEARTADPEIFRKKAKEVFGKIGRSASSIAKEGELCQGVISSFINANNYQLKPEDRQRIYRTLRRCGVDESKCFELERLYKSIPREVFSENRKMRGAKHSEQLESLKTVETVLAKMLQRLGSDFSKLSQITGHHPSYYSNVFRGLCISGTWKEPTLKALAELGAPEEEIRSLDAMCESAMIRKRRKI